MNVAARKAALSAAADECRRVAERLGLDAVGVMSIATGRRRVAWWAAAGSPPLPARLEHILEGKAEGWIVSTLPHGAAFARVTDRTAARAPRMLRTLGPSLLAAIDGSEPGAGELEDPELPVAPPARATPSRRTPEEIDALVRVADAIREALESAEGSMEPVLEATRFALGAREVFHLLHRRGRVEVTASPDGDWPPRVAPEVRAKLKALPRSGSVDDATARQLGVVLGTRSPYLLAAFASGSGPIEVVMAGWDGRPPLRPAAMGVVARLVALARASLDESSAPPEQVLRGIRERWAFEIHDGLTQAVTAAVLELESMRGRIQRDPKAALDSLSSAETEIRTSLERIRSVLFDLSDEGTSRHRTRGSLARHVDDVVRRWKLPARVSVEGEIDRIPGPVADAAYVVIRESLANAAKHSSSRNVGVRVHVGRKEVMVEIEDGGRGFEEPPAGLRRGRHFGLEMMRRRVAELDGTLEIESSPGSGTRVVARLPVASQGERG